MSYAFAQIESCGMNNENGFCDLNYGKFHVITQCVGNLGVCDCGEYVNKAIQIVQDECGLFFKWRNLFGWMLFEL
ncbi:hypothetical protein P3S67_031497 [Capsicum chacoense]